MAGTPFRNGYPFPFGWSALSNITPFTYRDGVSFAQLLYALKDYVTETVVPEAQGIVSEALDQFKAGMENAENHIIASEAEYRHLLAEMEKFVTDSINTVNNKTGGMDVQHVTLKNNYVVSVPAEWPNNHAIIYEFTQDSAGNHTVTYSGNIEGRTAVNMLPGAMTVVTLIPKVGGGWTATTVDTEAGAALRNGGDLLSEGNRVWASKGALTTVESTVNGRLSQASLDARYPTKANIAETIEPQLASVRGDVKSIADSTASIEELIFTFIIPFQGGQLATKPNWSANFTPFVAPMNMRILSIDLVFEYANIPRTSRVDFNFRRMRNGSGDYFATKSTTDDAVVARKPWSYEGAEWNASNAVFQKGDALNLAVSVGAANAEWALPIYGTVRYMPL